MSRPVRRSTGTGCHRIGPPRIRNMPGIFLPGSLEDRGLYRSYLRHRHLDSYRATPATRRIFAPTACVAVEGFRAMFAAERDNVYWRGFAPGRFRRGFFVRRIGPARVIAHGVMLQK
jgi:hypothetical protein